MSGDKWMFASNIIGAWIEISHILSRSIVTTSEGET